MSVTSSLEINPTKQYKEKDCPDTPIIIQNRVHWKKEMRRIFVTKLPIQKPSPRLSESTKSKNIPKNISKAIVQSILQGQYDQQIANNRKEFLSFIKKNKNIQNLNTLVKLTKPHNNPKINDLRKCFRQICWCFLNKQYVNYIFNSKIKDPQWHIQYRSDLLKIFLGQQ